MLLNLPNEIINIVISFLDKNSLINLLKTCKVIKDIILLDLYRFKKLDIQIKYLIYNIYKYDYHKNNIYCDYKTFKKRWNKFTFNIFNKIKWKDMIVAGGSICILLDKDKDINKFKDSDIDIFIYGNEINEKIEYLLFYIKKYNFNNIKYIYKDNIIEIFIENNRKIQIIPTCFKNPEEIIYSFDLSNVQIYYNGENVFASYLGFNSLVFKKTISTKTFILEERKNKYIERGYKYIGNDYFYLNRSSLYNILNDNNIMYYKEPENVIKDIKNDTKRNLHLYGNIILEDNRYNFSPSKVLDISNNFINIKDSYFLFKYKWDYLRYKDGDIVTFQSPKLKIFKKKEWDSYVLSKFDEGNKRFIKWLNINNIDIQDRLINAGSIYSENNKIYHKLYFYNNKNNTIIKYDLVDYNYEFDILNKYCKLVFSIKKHFTENKIFLHYILIYV